MSIKGCHEYVSSFLSMELARVCRATGCVSSSLRYYIIVVTSAPSCLGGDTCSSHQELAGRRRPPHRALSCACFSCLLAHVLQPCMVLHGSFYFAKELRNVLPATEPHGSPQGCTVRPRKGAGQCSMRTICRD